MSERTEWDEAVDEAIEQLIAEDTESFTLMTYEENDVHLIQLADGIEEELVGIFLLVTRVMQMGDMGGVEMHPPDVLAAAYEAAERRGLTSENAAFEELSD
jgi:hypothetical protein